MTRRTGNLTLFTMIQRERVLGQSSRSPGGGGVARRALQSKNSGMDGGFLVTGAALAGRIPEGLLNMAGRAFQDGVRAFQRKDLTMVKTGHIASAIMATHTVGSIELNVLGHKVGVITAMTINAGLGGQTKITRARPGMAIGARDGGAIEVRRMIDQLERGLGMLEHGLVGEVSRAPGLGGMAGGAILIGEHLRMYGRLRMAGGALGGRSLRGALGLMAVRALQLLVLTH